MFFTFFAKSFCEIEYLCPKAKDITAMKKAVIAILCILTCWACTQKPQTRNVHHIVVDYCDEDPESSSFINSYKNIPLEASSTESLINDIEKVLFTQHRIFIVDRIGNKVIMFDEKGNFLKSTAKMVGRGHNEYIRVIDAAVDEKEGKLYVHCDAPYQTMVFDLDLNVKEIIPLDYFMTEISIDDQFLYGLRHNEGQPAGFNVIAIPKDHLEANPDTILTYDKGIPGLLTMGKMLNACQDGIYVSMAFDNVIYRIGNGNILDEYVIDFGEKGLDEHALDEGMSRDRFERYYGDANWSIVNICSSDSIMLFNTNMATGFILNKNTGECKGTKYGLSFTELPSNSRFTPSQGLRNNVVVNEVAQHNLGYNLELVESGKASLKPERIKTMRELYEPDGNPVLVVSEIK